MSKTIRKLAATKLPRLYGFLMRVYKRFTSSSLLPNKSRSDDRLKMAFKQYVTQWRSMTFQIRHAVMMTSSVLMTSLIIMQ